MTIVEFLTARLDERQRAAEACAEVYPSPWEVSDRGWVARIKADEPTFRVVAELEQDPSIEGWLGDRLQHVAYHDPAADLADLAAKRAIVADYASRDGDADLMLGPDCLRQREWSGLRVAVRHLASIDSDHPDYNPDWSAA